MFFTLIKNGSFKSCPLKGSLENHKWFFYGITVKTPFWNLYFLRVYKEPFVELKDSMDVKDSSWNHVCPKEPLFFKNVALKFYLHIHFQMYKNRIHKFSTIRSDKMRLSC